MLLTKATALAVLALLVVLGAGLVFAGITAAHPGVVNQHIHSAVYHRTPAPVRHI